MFNFFFSFPIPKGFRSTSYIIRKNIPIKNKHMQDKYFCILPVRLPRNRIEVKHDGFRRLAHAKRKNLGIFEYDSSPNNSSISDVIAKKFKLP